MDDLPRLNRNVKHTVEVVVDRLRVRARREAAPRGILRDGVAPRRWQGDRGADWWRTRGPSSSAARRGESRPLRVRGSSISSPRSSPARCAATRCPSSSRGCFPSTTRWARARAATAWARSASSIRSASSPFPTSRSRRARSKAGTGATSSTSRCCSRSRSTTASIWSSPSASCRRRRRKSILHGSGAAKIRFTYSGRARQDATCASTRSRASSPTSSGATGKPTRSSCKEELAKYLNNRPCPECGGHAAAARGAARHAWRAGRSTSSPRCRSRRRRSFSRRSSSPAPAGDRRADRAGDRRARLQFLVNVGLDYLSLDRSADTLSGGEAQRIRLASQIGSGLTGVMYVLDEPSIGLHQRDNARLLATLKRLRDTGQLGHRRRARRGGDHSADHVVDMGLGAGEHGGSVVAQGTPAEVTRATGLAHRPVPVRQAPHRDPARCATAPTRKRSLTIERRPRQQPEEHRRRRFRWGCCVCVTGRLGVGQVHAHQRHALQRRAHARSTGPPPSPRRTRRSTGLELLRQGGQRRPEPDRAHAALQPGDLHRPLHARSASSSPACRKRARAATAPGASRST